MADESSSIGLSKNCFIFNTTPCLLTVEWWIYYVKEIQASRFDLQNSNLEAALA